MEPECGKNEQDLQYLLFLVEGWCKDWRLEVYLTKTNIMHVIDNKKKQNQISCLFLTGDLYPGVALQILAWGGGQVPPHIGGGPKGGTTV